MTYSHPKIKPELIELVRVNECIYNPKHKHYKNKPIKILLWEEIGAKLNVDAPKARELWRTLRDGYIRYKKALKSGKKSTGYIWSEHLSFLDEVIEPKDADTQESSQHQVFFSEDLYAKMGIDSPEQKPADCWVDSVPSSPMQEYAHAAPDYSYRHSQASRKRKVETMDKVIEYLQSKKRKEHDAVDLLFMSYAKSFKSLPARKQAKLKVTLAKVFAEAEFGDLDAESMND